MRGGRGGAAPQTSSPSPEGFKAAETKYVRIPTKYADKTTSGETATLKVGSQKKDITLKD